MVNVIGLGYIGLPTALMMASHGVEVVGTDYNEELVATLNAGKTTFNMLAAVDRWRGPGAFSTNCRVSPEMRPTMTMVRIMSVCAQSSCAIRYYPDKKLGGTALVPPLYKTCWFFCLPSLRQI